MSSTNTIQLSTRRRWLASEKIALDTLEKLGYKVIETRKKIVLNGIEVGEVDIVATDSNGNIYAIEVKAGKADISGIRQAYVNAFLINAKPLIICKGFADDAAKELAEKLNVLVIQLSDIFLIESEELNIIVRDVVEETLTEYLELFYGFNPNIKQEHIEILNAIYLSSTIDEAAEKLSLDIPMLMKKLDDLKRLGVIPKWAKKYNSIKRVAQILIQRQYMISALEESKKLIDMMKNIIDQTKQIQSLISTLNQQLQKLVSSLSRLEIKIDKTTDQQTQ